MSSVISVAKINDPYISPQRHNKQWLNHWDINMDLCLIHWNSPPCTSPTSLWMFVGTTDGTDITDTLCFCWDHKLVHSISIRLIRVIRGGSIRDEKRHIPVDFSILPVNGYQNNFTTTTWRRSQVVVRGDRRREPVGLFHRKKLAGTCMCRCGITSRE